MSLGHYQRVEFPHWIFVADCKRESIKSQHTLVWNCAENAACLSCVDTFGGKAEVSAAVESVILQVRGPRVLAAVLVGAGLAVAGTAFQGLFRNPLVSSDILGASSGAALGAVVGIFFSLGVFAIQALAFVGGLLAVAAVYVIGSAVRARDPILVLVLTGVVVGALLGAAVGLVKYLADPYNQLPAMTFWLLGSLAAANISDLLPLFGPVALGTAVLIALRWRMNVMSVPEEEARSLGVATGPLRIVIVAAATLTTSASVATAGIVGWVGLVVPHLARSLVGPDFARLLPAAAILGGGYLLLIDTLARTAAEVEIPLGILMRWLVRRSSSGYWPACRRRGRDHRGRRTHHRLSRPHGRPWARCRARNRRGAGVAGAERRR